MTLSLPGCEAISWNANHADNYRHPASGCGQERSHQEILIAAPGAWHGRVRRGTMGTERDGRMNRNPNSASEVRVRRQELHA
jgi:hypothetical protein